MKMPIAFVLINAEAGLQDEVIQELSAIDEVKNAYFVHGAFDIVAKIEALTSEKLKDTIAWKVRNIERISSTQTLLITSG